MHASNHRSPPADSIDFQRLHEFDFLRATEIAALNCLQWIGKGNKEAADAAACDAIRGMFDLMEVCGLIQRQPIDINNVATESLRR